MPPNSPLIAKSFTVSAASNFALSMGEGNAAHNHHPRAARHLVAKNDKFGPRKVVKLISLELFGQASYAQAKHQTINTCTPVDEYQRTFTTVVSRCYAARARAPKVQNRECIVNPAVTKL